MSGGLRELQDLVPPHELRRGHGGGEFRTLGRRWAETFELHAELRSGERVLDVGCGPGRMALALADRFGSLARYEGFDVRAEDIGWCQREIEPRWPNSRFQTVDLRHPLYNPRGTQSAQRFRFPYEEGAFDFVFLTSVFTHLLPHEVCNYLGEVSRVLRPGGRCLATFFLLNDDNRAAVLGGEARFSFQHSVSRRCRVELADLPRKVVCYEEAFVRRLCSLAGLELRARYMGSWSNVATPEPPRHSQDMLVVVKERAPRSGELRLARLALGLQPGLGWMKRAARRRLKPARPAAPRARRDPPRESPAPLVHGDPSSETPAPLLDGLPDEELRRLNALLPWGAFVVDVHGRRFGQPWKPDKRSEPAQLPDPRIVDWNDRVPLKGRTVLEVGCFEGIHTVALCRLGAEVTAVDARIENVVKTITRCALFDLRPRVLRWDLEQPPPPSMKTGWDLVHHVGVLYHLADPVAHLTDLASWTRTGLMLDTHVARPEDDLEPFTSATGREVHCKVYLERERDDPFAGMQPVARWLTEQDLLACLRDVGFTEVEVAERRDERNGLRLLLFASRT